MKLSISILLILTVSFLNDRKGFASELAITVDDLPRHGPLPEGMTRTQITQKMITAFKKHKVPEVYGFINSAKVSGQPDSEPNLINDLKLWVKAGYPLANHAFSHADIDQSSIEEFEIEIDRNEGLLKMLNEKMNYHFFRYPFLREGESLEKRNAIRDYLKKKNYQIAQVTVDFEDWSWNNPYGRCLKAKKSDEIAWLKKTYLENAVAQMKRAEIISEKLFKRPIKHILLLHIGAMDAEMIDDLLTAYEKIGVKFIGLTEAMKDPIYQIDPGIASKRGSELTYQILQARKLTTKELGIPSYEGYPEQKLDKVCR